MLSAVNIGFSIGKKTLLDDVSMEVAAGEMVALCGPNGAGKSTLLKVLSGELAAGQGKVALLSRDLETWDSSKLACVRAKLSQETQLTFAFRVREVVEMGRFPHDNPTNNDAVVQLCMERVGIEELSERYYTSLSGGEKQRVHLARVMAQLHGEDSEPRLLLLDEPTSALDLLHQEVALQLAHTLCKEQGFAVLVVLHDLNLAAAWADRIVLMKQGELRFEGEPGEVLTPEMLKEIYGIDVVVMSHPTTGRPIVTVDRALSGPSPEQASS